MLFYEKLHDVLKMIWGIVMGISNTLKTGGIAVFAALHVTMYLLPFSSWSKSRPV
jgi:hypothetical protein